MKIFNWKLVLSFYITLFIPLLYFINIALAYFFPNSIKSSIEFSIIGLFLAIIGLFIWILSYFHLGKSFGVLPQKQKRITKGLYKYLNHPMYVGVFLTFLGLSLTNRSSAGLIFLFFVTTPVLIIRAKLENKKLII
ncbi:MAG: methyltransferase [Candidatus Levyibacteriota bacterium]